ncbi:hypothetical protein R1sor_022851 [Riccia sorocarpa]|uniref:LsmAD domain-containing protein n=1 Tax=Riccia sorocarpa TaxID=122646 RepID=A0ABD3GP78_9MARC
MSQPQVQQRPAAANGVGRRRTERDVSSTRADTGFRSDSQNWRSSSQSSVRSGSNTAAGSGMVHGHGHLNSLSSTNAVVGGINRSSGDKAETGVSSVSKGADKPLHDRLVFMAMCLIGQNVEVQLKNGSYYSGIFHTANMEKDFGIVLKMARLIKDGSVKSGKSEAVKEAARKAPQKSLVIHAKDFVQIIAKDVALNGDAGLSNGRARENRGELATDSLISQGRQREVERELKPWKPDDDAPRSLALESTFQSSWNRNWDQFETNKALFGVETTFNEELYTTKLERGPQMREREREAWRIAREIEGQPTRNLHLAEERGIRLAAEQESMDEETRFSSVIRSAKLDVGEDGEDRNIDEHNEETFGGAFTSGASAVGGRDGGASTSPSGSSVSTSITRESDSKASRPSSADSTQTINGPSQKDSSLLLRERRAASIDKDKGEVAVLDSQADTHRERVRLRQLLVDDKFRRTSKAGGSPYHSPVGRASPLMSPLVGDPASIQALNLDPSCPQVPEEVYREFQQFKERQEKEKKTTKKQKEDQVNEFKNFSESLSNLNRIRDPELNSPKAAPKASSGDASNSSGKHGSQDGGARPAAQLEPKNSLPATASPVLLTTAQASAPPASALPIPVGLGGQMNSSQSTISSSSSRPAVSTAGSSFDASTLPTSAAAQSSGTQSTNGSPAPSGVNGGFGAPAPLTVPTAPPLQGSSPSISPSSSVSSVASGTAPCTKKSSLNPNAKEFKLNPNAKSFTPSFTSPRPASPMIQGPVYMHAGPPPVAPMQGIPVGMSVGQYMQQPGQPAQYSQYNNPMAAGAVGSSPQYMPPPGGYVQGVPGAGVPPVLPGQPNIKMPPQSQQQVVGPPYGQQQQLRYPPQGHPMQPQPAYLHPNGQLYPQQMMYTGQPGQVLYIQQFPQGMMQGQPVPPPPPQGPLPPQPSQQNQQQKHRGGGIPQMHYSGAPPPFLPGQHHLPQPQISHLHNTLQPAPGGLAPASIPGVQQPPQGMVVTANSAGLGGGSGIRVGGKGGAGSFSQQ